MFASLDYLSRCRELGILLAGRPLEPGMQIGRAYADLGVEEFSVLSENRIVSLFTGKISAITEGDAANFFQILETQELAAEIAALGYDISGVEFENQRTWAVTVSRAGEDSRNLFRHRELSCAFGDALLFVLKHTHA